MEEKLEYWVDKYENDTDAKDEELDALKASKAKNLEVLQRLAEEVRRQQWLSAGPCRTMFQLSPTLTRRRSRDQGKQTSSLEV